MQGKFAAHWMVGALAMGMISLPAFAQERAIGTPIGQWRVMGEADPMTDKNVCTAYYGAGHSVQLTMRSFAVSYRGRGMLRGYTIRFDDDAALPMALPGRTEERIGALIIDAGDPRWERMKTAKRIRIQALTVLGSVVNDDVDLSRLPELTKRLSGPGCS